MSQGIANLISGVTTLGQLYSILNTNFAATLSHNSGTTFPANPTNGWSFINTDEKKMYVYMDGWVDFTYVCPNIVSVIDEMETARGDATSLSARLNVALNEDGTLKSTAPASGWWAELPVPTYVSDSQFSVAGDYTAVFDIGRAIQILQSDVYYEGYVGSATFDSENTITYVTVEGFTVESNISTVSIGQEITNAPKRVTTEDVDSRACNSDDILAGVTNTLFATPAAMDEAGVVLTQKNALLSAVYGDSAMPLSGTTTDGVTITRNHILWTLGDPDTYTLGSTTIFPFDGTYVFHIYPNGNTVAIHEDFKMPTSYDDVDPTAGESRVVVEVFNERKSIVSIMNLEA